MTDKIELGEVNCKAEYYVYVYIDPRNFEEFYYGKGKGNRKGAHLSDDNDSEKSRRIKAILKLGLKPIIKVIAKDLTEKEAFLIEKTLIWKLGKTLTNKSSGHFADKFRPHDTLHQDLSGFDFKKGIYYVNVGEGIHRCWGVGEWNVRIKPMPDNKTNVNVNLVGIKYSSLTAAALSPIQLKYASKFEAQSTGKFEEMIFNKVK